MGFKVNTIFTVSHIEDEWRGIPQMYPILPLYFIGPDVH
jgi:hypothetical protein